MDLTTALTALSERVGDPAAALIAGLATGAAFGLAAQRSGFCLRSAAVETVRGHPGPRAAIWLLAVGAAILSAQAARMAGLFDSEAAQLMGFAGSWSGAAIGGLIFGAGMVLARGCSGRLLVLAGTGNLRCVLAGLVFALVAQASIGGILAPLRQRIAGVALTPDGVNIDLLAALGGGPLAGILIGAALLLPAAWLARRAKVRPGAAVAALFAGCAISLGWVLTAGLAQVSFEPVGVVSASFAAPSAGVVMSLMTADLLPGFSPGLIAGVFAGAFLGGLIGGELRLEGYHGPAQMLRSLAGGALMGFGGVLAGGCAIGAGVTGLSIFVAPLCLATLCFFIGAWATDRLADPVAAETHARVQLQR